MQVSGLRAIMAVRDALDRQGLVRTSSLNGACLLGWSPPNTFDSTTMNIRRDRDGTLAWRVVVSGRPHLSYRKSYGVAGDGDPIDLHEPVSPERLHGKVRAAFVSLGIEPLAIENAGHQEHWDDDVSYMVRTTHPEWLAPQPRENHHPMAPDVPTLCTFALKPDSRSRMAVLSELCSSASGSVGSLVGYVDHWKEPLLTRSALEALAELPVLLKDEWRELPEGGRGLYRATSSFLAFEAGSGPEPDAVVYRRLGDWRGLERPVLEPPAKVATASAETIRNTWGDEVSVWRFPPGSLERMRSFVQRQSVLVGGEWTDQLSFQGWDAQFGPSPWNPEGIPCPARGMAP